MFNLRLLSVSHFRHCNSEALYVPSAELDLQPHSLDIVSQEGGDGKVFLRLNKS